MDFHRFLVTEDPMEALVFQTVVNRTLELSEIQDRNRAAYIAEAVGKMFKP